MKSIQISLPSTIRLAGQHVDSISLALDMRDTFTIVSQSTGISIKQTGPFASDNISAFGNPITRGILRVMRHGNMALGGIEIKHYKGIASDFDVSADQTALLAGLVAGKLLMRQEFTKRNSLHMAVDGGVECSAAIAALEGGLGFASGTPEQLNTYRLAAVSSTALVIRLDNIASSKDPASAISAPLIVYGIAENAIVVESLRSGNLAILSDLLIHRYPLKTLNGAYATLVEILLNYGAAILPSSNHDVLVALFDEKARHNTGALREELNLLGITHRHICATRIDNQGLIVSEQGSDNLSLDPPASASQTQIESSDLFVL